MRKRKDLSIIEKRRPVPTNGDNPPLGDVAAQKTSCVNHTDFHTSRQRSMNDLPGRPGLMNGIGAILLYTFYGVSDREICEAIKITVPELRQIREHPAFADAFSTIVDETINANSELLNSRLAAYSHKALTSVADVLDDEEAKPTTKLRAAQDLLDRGDVTAKSRAARENKNELRIIVTKADGTPSLEVNGVTLE